MLEGLHSCNFTTQDKTQEEIMKIQSATNNKPAIKSELTYEADNPAFRGNRPTFKKPISYSKCGKLFTSTCKLKTHERIHTGEKPFGCSKCDKKFSQAGHLKTHERIHADEKPFSCSKCDYKCSDPSALKTHERIHTGEKPFSCSKCDKKFTTSGNLKIHERMIKIH